MKKFSLTIIASLMALSLTACDFDGTSADKTAEGAAAPQADAAGAAPAGAGAETKTDTSAITFDDKVSMAMGYMYGRSMREGFDYANENSNVKLNRDVVIKSLNAALDGEAPALSQDEITAVLTEFNKQIQDTLKERKEQAAAKNLKEGQEFLEKNKANEGVQVTESGLQYKIEKLGEGPKPAATDTIRVNYTGKTIDGKVFDKSEKPVEFQLNHVVKGWSEGFQLLPVGTKATLYLPAELGYGDFSPSPDIPENSVLIFDVEFLDIVPPAKPEAKDAPAASEKDAKKADAPKAKAGK